VKIYVQWAIDPAGGWHEYDSSQWADLPKKAVPGSNHSPIFDVEGKVTGFESGSEVMDDSPGWINRLNVQGVLFFGDHIAVAEPLGKDYIEVYYWFDDPDDYQEAEMTASVWRFHPLISGEKPNTLQYCTRYIHSTLLDSMPPSETTGGPVIYHPLEDFAPPEESLIRHGIWMPDTLIESLRGFSPEKWRSWL